MGDAPNVELAINDDSDARFSACENKFPDAWHINCFTHFTRVNIPKCKNCLHSGLGTDEITKDLAGT